MKQCQLLKVVLIPSSKWLSPPIRHKMEDSWLAVSLKGPNLPPQLIWKGWKILTISPWHKMEDIGSWMSGGGFPRATCEINSPLRFHSVLTPPVRVETDRNEGVRKETWNAIKPKGYYIPAKVKRTLLAHRFGSFQSSLTSRLSVCHIET